MEDGYYATLRHTEYGIPMPPEGIETADNILDRNNPNHTYMVDGTRFVLDPDYPHTIPQLFKIFHKILVDEGAVFEADSVLFGIELYSTSGETYFNGAWVYITQCGRDTRFQPPTDEMMATFEWCLDRWERIDGYPR